MAALIRCLTNLAKPSSHETAIPRLNATSKPSTRESKLESLVKELKISSQDPKFRRTRKGLYIRHVRRLADAKQFDMIEDLIEHQKTFHDIHNESFAVRLISLYGDSGMFENARKLFDELPDLGCPRTLKSFNALLKSGFDAKEFRKVVELFEDLRSEFSVEPNEVTYTTVICALYELGSFEEADRLWAKMEECGIEPTIVSYNIRLKRMFSEKNPDEAVLLVGEMRKKGHKPDTFTYNTLIVGLCENGNLEEAKMYYDELQKSKCGPHLASTYWTLTWVCCKSGDFDKAFEVCSDAVKHNISLNLKLFKMAINGVTKTAEKFDVIENVIEQQKKLPEIHNEGFAVRLISLYGESGMFEHARKLFDDLPDLGCPRTVKSFNALLKSGVDAKEFQRVIKLFKDLPSAVSVEPDMVTHNTVAQALCEMGSRDEILSVLREMDKDATIVTFNALLTALYKSNRSAEAESLWAAMEESETGVKPDARSYNIKMRARIYEKKDREALLLADEMKSKGIEPDAFTYNILIRGFCDIGKLEEAMKSYDDLRKSKCTEHLVTTYLALIPACCEAGDFDKAFEICSDAVKNKVLLSPEVFEQVINGLTNNGRNEVALELKNLISTPY